MRLLVAISFLQVFGVCTGCQPKEYMTCVTQVNTQKVPFDSNIMGIVFNITSEAMLLKTCRAYQNVLPCFEQRFAVCGTLAQKQLLEKGKRMHKYLCAPFSLQRQKIFLRRVECVQSVLETPVDGQCNKGNNLLAKKVASCRVKCSTSDRHCMAKIQESELGVCLVLKIEEKCGAEASQFYSEMQQVLINKEYPVQCKYSFLKAGKEEKRSTSTEQNFAHPSRTEAAFRDRIKENMKKINTTAKPSVRRVDINRSNRVTGRKDKQGNMVFHFPTQVARVQPVVATINRGPPLLGARPIPNSMYSDDSNAKVTTTTINPANIWRQPSSVSPLPLSTKMMQWSAQQINNRPGTVIGAKENYNPLPKTMPNPKIRLNSGPPTTTINPLFMYRPPAKDAPTNNGYPNTNNSGKPPLKIHINWVNPDETTTVSSSIKVTVLNDTVHPTLVQQNDSFVEGSGVEGEFGGLDLKDLSNKASNYFNAAVSAIEEKALAPEADAWSKLAGIVAPAIQKISPSVINRLKQELDRID